MKNNLGTEIRKARLRIRNSLKELSKKTGLDAGYLSRIENGLIKNPKQLTINKIAIGLGCDIFMGCCPLCGGELWVTGKADEISEVK